MPLKCVELNHNQVSTKYCCYLFIDVTFGASVRRLTRESSAPGQSRDECIPNNLQFYALSGLIGSLVLPSSVVRFVGCVPVLFQVSDKLRWATGVGVFRLVVRRARPLVRIFKLRGVSGSATRRFLPRSETSDRPGLRRPNPTVSRSCPEHQKRAATADTAWQPPAPVCGSVCILTRSEQAWPQRLHWRPAHNNQLAANRLIRY